MELTIAALWGSGPSYAGLALVAVGSVLSLRLTRTALRLLRCTLWPWARSTALVRWVERAPLATTSRDLREGTTARLSGIVVGDHVGRTRLKGRPAVAWSFDVRGDVGNAIDGGAEALDFLIRLDDGELVRVRAADAAANGTLRVVGAGESLD